MVAVPFFLSPKVEAYIFKARLKQNVTPAPAAQMRIHVCHASNFLREDGFDEKKRSGSICAGRQVGIKERE